MNDVLVNVHASNARLQKIADGEWRGSHEGLGLVVYGSSPEQIREKLSSSAVFLLEQIEANFGLDAVKSRLALAGASVSFEMTEINDSQPNQTVPLALAMTAMFQHA